MKRKKRKRTVERGMSKLVFGDIVKSHLPMCLGVLFEGRVCVSVRVVKLRRDCKPGNGRRVKLLMLGLEVASDDGMREDASVGDMAQDEALPDDEYEGTLLLETKFGVG